MKTMVLKWDSTTERDYTKSKQTNKTNIYIDDKRSNVPKPSKPYMKYLQGLLLKWVTDKALLKQFFQI